MKRTGMTVMAILIVGFAVSATMADIQFFANQTDFETFMAGQGSFFEDIETFEENNAPDNEHVEAGAGSMTHGVPWLDDDGFGFPTGLDHSHVTVRAHMFNYLLLATDGCMGAVTSVVGPNFPSDTTDLVFSGPDKFGIGLDLCDLMNDGPHISDILIYDTNGVLIGTTTSPSPQAPVFWGVWSDMPIGVINIAGRQDGVASGGELVDNIQTWVPEPASLALFGLGALLLRKRR